MAGEKFHRAARARSRNTPHFAEGQWVFVWRRAARGPSVRLPRDRWVGPALVIKQAGHAVWVAVRSRIWRCSADQVRPAEQS
eukprot:14400123-Alexandrium_andersonii.AAC.1